MWSDVKYVSHYRSHLFERFFFEKKFAFKENVKKRILPIDVWKIFITNSILPQEKKSFEVVVLNNHFIFKESKDIFLWLQFWNVFDNLCNAEVVKKQLWRKINLAPLNNWTLY